MKMTDKRLAKRLGELYRSFHHMCVGRHCEDCEMKAFSHEGVCCLAYVLKKMTEVEESKRKCESCKYFRRFGAYVMSGCDKHGRFDPKKVCKDYEQKGGEE